MSRRFEGKAVWITGASSGIGEALAHAYAKEGARVLLSARRESELARVAGAIGANAKILTLDLEAINTHADKARQAEEIMGPIDVVVHNGGISQRARASATKLEVVERLMRVNFLGTVSLTHAILPQMIARKNGHFVIITSLVGIFGTPLRSAYAASKHALHGYFESLRAEHASDRIDVTIVCPGFIRTQVSMNALTADGSPQGTMDHATGSGMSADRCATEIVAATHKRRTEVYVGGLETFAVFLHRASPTLFAKLMARAKVT